MTAVTSTQNTASSLNALRGVTPAGSDAAGETSDRFLKLLVTQMQNQDPLNPMDNAQVTSQMAQINTVTGISDLNKSMSGMSSLLLQMQTLQGASLVGHDVLVAGNALVPDDQGLAQGGFELDGPADSVLVSISDANGKLIDRIQLGAAGAGRHSFDWTAGNPAPAGLSFAITARSATTPVTARTLVSDRVESVYSDGGKLTVELRRLGPVDYSSVRAFN